METPKAKCSECGFLARMNPEQQYCEVPQHTRETGHYPHGADRPLYCIKGKRDISKEVGGHYDNPPRLIAVIQADYDCNGYTKYRCGFSPKEHMEMDMVEELRARHAAEAEKLRLWQEEVRARDKQIAEENRRADREWQERQTAEKRHDDWKRLAASSALGAAVPILMFIIARYFK